MNCPRCQGNTRVLDSRRRDPQLVRRRRECLDCGKRFPTWEIPKASVDRLGTFLRARDKILSAGNDGRPREG
jgi:transcriptional regulator NrdR family protein